jgi:hypothetical protein
MARHAPKDEIPNAAWRAKLVNRLVRLGYRGTDLADIIAPSRTRDSMADDMIVIQRKAPKA